MPPDQLTVAPTHTRQRIVWLIVVHIVVGLTGAFVTYFAGPFSQPSLLATVFVCLVSSQTSLLGIWGGLGTSPWWKRLIGVLVGISYLVPLLGIGIHEVNSKTFIVVVVATSCVLTPLLIVRFFGVVIHLGSSSVAPVGHIQFSIRHLMILTFVIACLISIGKLVQPLLFLLLIALTLGVVGVLPVWFVLATKRPILYSIGLVAVGACAGYCLGRWALGEEEIWTTATATETLAVAISLLVVRSCGYRLVRLPSRHQANKLAGDAVVHPDTRPL